MTADWQLTIRRDARLSPDRRYRYGLSRRWDPQPFTQGRILWVMLNPSTANAEHDDATIRRVCGFSHLWNYHNVRVVNLYAYRATDPMDLWIAAGRGIDIIGPRNDAWITKEAAKADRVIVAWGNQADYHRPFLVYKQLKEHVDAVYCLGETVGLQPVHPLRIPYAAELREWVPREARARAGARAR